ncbi:MAG: winged helix-turn-helix domain-containing protein [candidate division Zixibacteria bacterium]|nr:winged helix-turn-helix domain-containing protein [candidate division Zixibacteria bacterium]MBU1471083.1 winged helix-turn-helix domain-containing protein [candidate division Zixibacteria bacterium]
MKEEMVERLLVLQKQARNIREWRRLEVVWLRERLGLSGPEVSAALNYKLQTVHVIWHQWIREKELLFRRPAPGGRKHAYLTLEEEKEFLAPFFRTAEAGGVLTVTEIKEAYEGRVNRKVAPSTVYRLLHRHGWRKIVPRKRHPKSDPQKQEKAKKT